MLGKLLQGKLNNVENPDAYVFQIAGNMLRDRQRKQIVRDRYAQDIIHIGAEENEVFDPERIASGREQLRELVANLDRMPELTRQIFVLCRFENMKRQEVADALGVSLSTVTNHLSRALARLTV